MIAWLWYGKGAAPQLARILLSPFALLFIAARGLRNALYDLEWRRSLRLAIPSVSVGNLSVGGTGKTPVSRWISERLRAQGATPAVLLRGYGTDEVALYQRAGILVVPGADRVASAERAAASGATIAILDDGFQHRRADREADIVLISADAWQRVRWPLPVGPWREGLGALRRAHLVVITRKAATFGQLREVRVAVQRVAPTLPIVVAMLSPRALVAVGGSETLPLSTIQGETLYAVSAIGDPNAFAAQLRAAGAVVSARAFRDHHEYTDADVASILQEAAGRRVVCTEKDAVKLVHRWPASAPQAWYLSQSLEVTEGADALDLLLHRLGRPTRP
ncbi:MAG: tetraacyldisaccharide 4'-kinase [Gemmatimonadaceae bacterium]|nr:tetraacyldisaccharide 4'-kinase [Gemmatimonadaceae bacterium]